MGIAYHPELRVHSRLRLVNLALALGLLSLVGPGPAMAQSSARTAGAPLSQPKPADAGTAVKVKDPARAKLIADTQKLLALSRELRAEIGKSNPDTLSLTLIKKVEEVQKLAATVKAETDRLP